MNNRLKLMAAGALLATSASSIWAQSADEVEALGTETGAPGTTPDQSAIRGQARGDLLASGVLLIPESTNDRVMAFDPETGDLIDPDFIPADATNLSTPIQVHLDAAEDTFLVSDQIGDGLFAYDLDGNPLGIFAPAGGVDNSIADNVRGFAVDPDNGNLLVSVGSGANAGAVVEFDTAGNHVGNRVDPGTGGSDSPFDVYFRAGDLLVPDINANAVLRYETDGTFIEALVGDINFPEQIYEIDNGNLLVASFSGAGNPGSGVAEYESDGTFIALHGPITGNRGAYELGNGNILTTDGSGVYEIDRAGNLVETKIGDVSARFITFVQLGGPVDIPETTAVPTLNPVGLAVLILLLAIASVWILQRRRRA